MFHYSQESRTRWRWLIASAAALFVALSALMVSPGHEVLAAEIVVDSTLDDDEDDNDAGCSLREASVAVRKGGDPAWLGGCSNTGGAWGTDDTIIVPAGTYTLTIDYGDGGGRDIDLTTHVVISGAGASETVVQANTVHPSGAATVSRIFHIATTTPTVEIRDLTIRYGQLDGYGKGAGIRNEGHLTLLRTHVESNWKTSAAPGVYGGGIYVGASGVLTVSDSTIWDNDAVLGGGIGSEGSLMITGTTIYSNSVQRQGASEGDGGGLWMTSGSGTSWIENSTISGNHSKVAGAGIRQSGGALKLVHTSIVSNTSNGYNAAGLHQSGGTVSLTNTLLVNNRTSYGGAPDDNCTNIDSSEANSDNMDDDGSCGAATQKTSAEINVGPLADNGGPTWTHALLSGSAAIDHVASASCAATVDQRGISRPQGAGCDVGAFELLLPLPQLSIEKTVNEVNPESNDTIIYTLVISNGGNAAATGGVISDVIPTGLTYVANSAVIEPAGAGTVGAPAHLVSGLTITAGTSVTLTFQATVNGGLTDGTTITNTAWVTSAETPTPATDSVTVTVDAPEVVEVTFELDLVGMAITGYEPESEGYLAGILDWEWTILNPNAAPVSNIYFDVVQLDASIAEVINRDGGTPPGAGARVSVPNSALGGDELLTQGETYDQVFNLGWHSYTGFTFQVRAFGVVGGTPLVAGEPLLLGTFTAEFDPSMVDIELPQQGQDANKIFLPLIQR